MNVRECKTAMSNAEIMSYPALRKKNSIVWFLYRFTIFFSDYIKSKILLALVFCFISISCDAEYFWVPSYNCLEASSVADITVCNIPMLSSHDRYVAKLHQKVVEIDSSQIKMHQEWEKEKRYCRFVYCLERLYINRINQLIDILARVKLKKQVFFNPRKFYTELIAGQSKTDNHNLNYLKNSGIKRLDEMHQSIAGTYWSFFGYSVSDSDFGVADIYLRTYSGHGFSPLHASFLNYDFVITVDSSIQIDKLPKVTEYSTYSVRSTAGLNLFEYSLPEFKIEKSQVCKSLFLSRSVAPPSFYRHKLTREQSKVILDRIHKGDRGGGSDQGYSVFDVNNDGVYSPVLKFYRSSGAGSGCSFSFSLELNESLDSIRQSTFNDFMLNNTHCGISFEPRMIQEKTYLLKIAVNERVVEEVYSIDGDNFTSICESNERPKVQHSPGLRPL